MLGLLNDHNLTPTYPECVYITYRQTSTTHILYVQKDKNYDHTCSIAVLKYISICRSKANGKLKSNSLRYYILEHHFT